MFLSASIFSHNKEKKKKSGNMQNKRDVDCPSEWILSINVSLCECIESKYPNWIYISFTDFSFFVVDVVLLLYRFAFGVFIFFPSFLMTVYLVFYSQSHGLFCRFDLFAVVCVCVFCRSNWIFFSHSHHHVSKYYWNARTKNEMEN